MDVPTGCTSDEGRTVCFKNIASPCRSCLCARCSVGTSLLPTTLARTSLSGLLCVCHNGKNGSARAPSACTMRVDITHTFRHDCCGTFGCPCVSRGESAPTCQAPVAKARSHLHCSQRHTQVCVVSMMMMTHLVRTRCSTRPGTIDPLGA